jgi:hypothetical protein
MEAGVQGDQPLVFVAISAPMPVEMIKGEK